MIDKLEMLLALACEQHLGRTAEPCAVTQPTMSSLDRCCLIGRVPGLLAFAPNQPFYGSQPPVPGLPRPAAAPTHGRAKPGHGTENSGRASVVQYEPWNEARGAEIIAALAGQEGATMPILHALQAAFGCVPAAAVPMIAATLNLTRAEVHGIISFYHDFRSDPPGRHVLKLCRAEACQSLGAEALAAQVRQRLAVDWHGTTPDGAVTLEPVYCLGLCAVGPAALLDDKPLGRLDEAGIEAAVESEP